jgi:hypothetical protein
MKKMLEVTCCDGCGHQFSEMRDMQSNETELDLRDCKVKVTLTVDDKPAELCVSCLTSLCYDLEKRPFY